MCGDDNSDDDRSDGARNSDGDGDGDSDDKNDNATNSNGDDENSDDTIISMMVVGIMM